MVRFKELRRCCSFNNVVSHTGCLASIDTCAVKPVTSDHPLGPEKAVFSGRWSLVAGGP